MIDGGINKDVRFVIISHTQFCQLSAKIFHSSYECCSDTVVFFKPRYRFTQKFMADASIILGFH